MLSTYNQADLTLAFTYCLYRVSRLSRDENLGASWFFPEHTHSPVCEHGFLDFPNYMEHFSECCGHLSSSPAFLLKGFGQLVVCPNSHCHLKQLQFLKIASISTNNSGENIVCIGQALSQVK